MVDKCKSHKLINIEALNEELCNSIIKSPNKNNIITPIKKGIPNKITSIEQLYSLTRKQLRDIIEQTALTPTKIKYIYVRIKDKCPCCKKKRDINDSRKYLEFSDFSICADCGYKSLYNPNDHFHCCEIRQRSHSL